MQPINSRMLLHHIAATGSLPPLDDIPVVHSAHITVDDDTRSRYKWLSHLPLFTPVVIADVDLNGIVGEETMQAFKQELLHRSLRWAQVSTMFFFAFCRLAQLCREQVHRRERVPLFTVIL
jgi:hypothetical protein